LCAFCLSTSLRLIIFFFSEKCITWSVEWVDDDGQRHLRDQKDTEPVISAYPRRSGNQDRRPRRGARDQQQTPGQEVASSTAETISKELDVPLPPQQDSKDSQLADDDALSGKPKKEIYFYLLKPRVPSVKKVLIPLDASQNLYQCLQHQVVLEYPTIYALSNPPDSLPDGFLLEADFLSEFKKEQMELNELLKDVKPVSMANRKDGEINTHEKDWDPNQVMEVLKKDLDSIG
jgi:hypothetical protein